MSSERQPASPLQVKGRTAILVDALTRAWNLARIADLAGAMTVEATKSSRRPFDPRIQAIRPHPGQAACAGNLRRLLADSEVMASHAHCAKGEPIAAPADPKRSKKADWGFTNPT